jgi:3-oxoacyl-(acyl-carrier-protein) synthase
MMGVDFGELVAVHRHSAADGALDATRLLDDASANNPLAFCRSQATTGVSLLTRRHDIRGYATSVHTACASGGQAIGTALKLIRRGAVDCALAGGFDSMISPVGIAGFCLLSALSADNDTPQRASRPFDATRNGFLLGEGAGFVILQEWSRRDDAARTSTPSWPATAIRSRATASPIPRPTVTVRSRRCARPSPTPAQRSMMSITSTRTVRRPR